MGNLDLYNKVRNVPETAQKEIKGGRLKGMTDINPQWRIQTLTEQFGVCGFGWKIKILRLWLEEGAGETTANAEIELYIKIDGEWSDGIAGVGGSKFVSDEKDGPFTSDECYKMAVTDAISVACKMLGIGADIYWQQNRTKYSSTPTKEIIGGEYVMTSGKHKGKKLSEIPADYLDWYLDNGYAEEIKQNILKMRSVGKVEEVDISEESDLPF